MCFPCLLGGRVRHQNTQSCIVVISPWQIQAQIKIPCQADELLIGLFVSKPTFSLYVMMQKTPVLSIIQNYKLQKALGNKFPFFLHFIETM